MRTQKQKPSKERRWDSAWRVSKEGFMALFPCGSLPSQSRAKCPQDTETFPGLRRIQLG